MAENAEKECGPTLRTSYFFQQLPFFQLISVGGDTASCHIEKIMSFAPRFGLFAMKHRGGDEVFLQLNVEQVILKCVTVDIGCAERLRVACVPGTHREEPKRPVNPRG